MKKDTTPQSASPNFWSLLRESVISQLLLSLMVMGGVIATYLIKGDIPPFLQVSAGLVVGYFFGAKEQKTLTSIVGRETKTT